MYVCFMIHEVCLMTTCFKCDQIYVIPLPGRQLHAGHDYCTYGYGYAFRNRNQCGVGKASEACMVLVRVCGADL